MVSTDGFRRQSRKERVLLLYDRTTIKNRAAAQLLNELANLPEAYPGRWQVSAGATYLLGCRLFNQWCGTLRSLLDPAQFCLFCHPKLMLGQPIAEIDGWYAKLNDFKYPNHEHHFVLTPKRHVLHPSDLNDEDAVAQQRLMQWIMREFHFDAYDDCMRAGDPRRTCATVPHLHRQLQVPTGHGEAWAIFGKNMDHQMEDYDRLRRFLVRLIELGGIDWLMNPATVPPRE